MMSDAYTGKVRGLIIDEAHCMKKWYGILPPQLMIFLVIFNNFYMAFFLHIRGRLSGKFFFILEKLRVCFQILSM